MNVQNVSVNSNNNVDFGGRAIVCSSTYNAKKMEKIARQLNQMRIVKNSEADVYLSQPFYEVKVSAQKGKFDTNAHYKHGITTVLDAGAVMNAARRAIAKFDEQKALKEMNKPETFLGKIKKFISNLMDR